MKRRSRVSSIARLGLPLALAVGAAMIVWTWGTWPDPLVDFGRELYVPWQLWQGKVLYRDVAHFNGPLSAYFNALLYLIFGVSLRSIVIGNLAIAAGVTWMVHALYRRAGGERFSATVAGLLFVTIFLPLQLVDIGNYNWVTPYSHELTHGVALSLLSLLMLSRYLAHPRAIWSFACGFTLGCVFLTKVEVCAAAAPSLIFGLILAMRALRGGGSVAGRQALAFIIASIIPPLAAIALLATAMPLADALRGIFASWRYALDPRIGHLAFYRHTMGTDFPAANIVIALKQSALYLLALGPAAVIGIWLRGKPARWAGVAYALVLALVLALLRPRIPWHDGFRGLSVVAAAIAIVAITGVARSRFRPRPRAILRLVLSLFALLLLAKMFLAATLHNYGFALAMPAMLVAAAAATSWIPQWLERRGKSGAVLRGAGVAALAVVVYVHLSAFKHLYRDARPVVIAKGTADQFSAQDRGFLVNELTSLLSVLSPGTTVAVVPQGVMVNYLAARNNPTPYVTLMPPEVLMYGDGAIAAAYAQNPPDVVVIIGSDLREYGYDSFEQLAPQTAAWLRANYAPVRSIEMKDLPPATILQRAKPSRPQMNADERR